MGNKPFKIGVQLDQPEGRCQAGDVISGKVLLSINRLSDVKAFQGIHLVLNGTERCEVAFKPGSLEYDKRRRAGKPPHAERSLKTIVHVDYPLVDIRGIQRGQYEYPFQLPLREDLPASMFCSAGDNHHNHDRSFCEIHYTLTAYIASAGLSNTAALNDEQMRHETRLVLKGAPTADPNPRPIRSDTEIYPITACWFWSQGHVALGWSSDMSVAAPGDNVHVRIWGENQSKLSVEYISVKWMETTTWRTEPQPRGSESAPCQRSTKRLLAEQRHSVHPHPQWHSTKQPGGAQYQALTQQQDGPDQFPVLVSTLKIPHNARETYRGRLVEVKHVLVVSAVTTGGYTSTTPESAVSVQIRPRGVAANVPPAPTSATASATTATASSPVEPSAPSEFFDDAAVVVEAQAVPDDWDPVSAEEVRLPLASAVIISDSSDIAPIPVPQQRQQPASAPDESLMTRVPAVAAAAVLSPPTASASADPALAKTQGGSKSPAPSLTTTTTTPLPPPPQISTNDETDQLELEQLAQLCADCPENLSVVAQDPAWAARFQGLTPRQFCQFVQTAPSPQMPALAKALAQQMGPSFQSKHVLACLWTLPSEHRLVLLRDVAPLASDLPQKMSMMQEELNEEELLVLESALRSRQP